MLMSSEKWRHAEDCEAVKWPYPGECNCGLLKCGDLLRSLLAALEHGAVVLDGEGIRGLERGTIFDRDDDENMTAPDGTIVVAWSDGTQSGFGYANDHGLYRIVPLPEEPHA